MRYLLGFLMALGVLCFVACGQDGNGVEPVNVAGDWQMTSTVISDTCDGRMSQTFQMTIMQQGNTLTAETPELTFGGTINGNRIQMSGSFPEDGGTVTVNATLTVSAVGDSMQGSDNWTWTDGLESCSGSDSLSGIRIGAIVGGPSDQVSCSDSSPCTVWLLGDSNTAAMGDNFVSIDGNHPEYDTVNLGRGGASSADGLADVESLLAVQEAPEIAVVTYAGGDFLESYPAAPPGATSPTRADVDQIYGNLEAICELLQSEGTYCVLGKSIGALTELHPLDEGLPPGAIDFAALTYFDNGYVLVGEAIEERYQPGWVSFRVPKDFDLWDHGDLFGYVHLTQAGYSIMSDRLEGKLDDLIRD